ncbi:MAG: type II secretory pathway component [Alkalimonas sp.]|nr:type II secretory pathway component [Alkalimonas sp.]
MFLKRKKQQGSALVVAIFVIVVVLGLLLALTRILTSSSESVVYEVLGTRALFAAQSGLELASTQLFPLEQPVATCSAVSTEFNFSGSGLRNCRARVACAASTPIEVDGAERIVFQLTSTGECRSGSDWSLPCQSNEQCSSRTLQVEVGQ